MTPLFGQTRTRVGARYALITPDGHVPSAVPGIEGAHVVAHITPAMGAGFVQGSITFEEAGCATLAPGDDEYVFFLQEGSIELKTENDTQLLGPGSYFYLPPLVGAEICPKAAYAKLTYFQKKFVPLDKAAPPKSFLGHADKIKGQPFLGNPQASLQVLLPEDQSFDLALNIFTYQPGATLPFVETHVMEHGLLMLAGQGIYRLEDDWYPVAAGDVIWMAPYCPQWFVAIGDTPASYLYYKNVNRPLLLP